MAAPLLCVTVSAASMADLRRRRDQVADADLVELRLDGVRDPDVAGALAGRRGPVVVTCRPAWEGGRFAGSEAERRRLLSDALDRGADFVDIEWRAGFDDLVVRGGDRVVLSHHDPSAVPADLEDRYRAMRRTGAAVVKVAVGATDLSDLVRLFDVARASAGRHVWLALGALGLPSRVLAARFGSVWTYAGFEAGVGQIAPGRLVGEFRYRETCATTPVYVLAGSPIGHSLSPAMHNALFRAHGIDAVYVPCETTDAEDFLQFCRTFAVRGASVTIPLKSALPSRADALDDLAARTGALNTLRIVDGRIIGSNTDVDGFLAALDGVALGGARCAVIGAGGAARAVVIALASRGARVVVYGRSRQRAEAVAALAPGTVARTGLPEAGSWDLLVNATPVGAADPDATPVPRSALESTRGSSGRRPLVYDLVYHPTATRLRREAAEAGCETIGGLAMLVAQARLQFEAWTGIRPDPSVLERAAQARLADLDRDATEAE